MSDHAHGARARSRRREVRAMHITAQTETDASDPRLVALYDALSALRRLARSEDSLSPSRDPYWRVVERYLRDTWPRALGDDLRQDVLLTMFLHVHSLRALRPRSAAAWIRSIRHSKRMDAQERYSGIRLLSTERKLPPLALAAPVEPPLEIVEAILCAFEAEAWHTLASDPNPARRHRRLQRVRAALRRLVLHERLETVARHLGVDASPALVAKWVERGRADILATLERLRSEAPDAAEQYETLEALARRRRSDAGRPRPERRRAAQLS
ncbi:MAG: hypothetical protein M5U28_28140 [Sandaracinaceae bacterium]|nr:hypothetical protein [Sandaracinaceae bacterium]